MVTADTKRDLTAEQPQGRFSKWLPWVTKGALAVADQGVFALSNFLLNVLLIRWLTPGDYGAFALAFSVFLFLLIVHNALVTTPMLVFGQGKYRENFSDYLGVLLGGHFALMLPGSGLLVAASFLLGHLYSPAVEHALLGLAIAAPFISLLWLLRRAFYARLEPIWAASSGAAYFVILIVGTALFHATGVLSPATGFLAMAAASVITSALLLFRLRPTWAMDSSSVRAVYTAHWSYGRWVAAGAFPNWVTDNIYYLFLPASLGLAGAGALKALLNLAQPASQSISALGALLMPILVNARAAGGDQGMKRTIKLTTVLFLSGSVAYAALLWVLRHQVFHSLYGSKFAGYDSWPLLALGLIPIAQGLPNVVGAAVGAIERPQLGFWADSWSAGCALIVGVPLTFWLGVGGALLGIALTYTVMGFLTLFFFMRSLSADVPVVQARTGPMPGAMPGPMPDVPGWTEAS